MKMLNQLRCCFVQKQKQKGNSLWGSLSNNLNSPSPSAQVQVNLTMNISANLQSLFTWNTKQVFVFLATEYESETYKNSLNQEGIIASKDHAKFWIHTSNKYRLIDQGSNLRGKEFNLTMN